MIKVPETLTEDSWFAKTMQSAMDWFGEAGKSIREWASARWQGIWPNLKWTSYYFAETLVLLTIMCTLTSAMSIFIPMVFVVPLAIVCCWLSGRRHYARLP